MQKDAPLPEGARDGSVLALQKERLLQLTLLHVLQKLSRSACATPIPNKNRCCSRDVVWKAGFLLVLDGVYLVPRGCWVRQT